MLAACSDSTRKSMDHQVLHAPHPAIQNPFVASAALRMRPSRLSSALSSLCTRWKAWGRVPPFAAPERLCICSMTGTEGESLPKQAKFASRLQVKKLSEHAVLPTRGSAGAAGYDLSASQDCVIPARGRGLVSTDLSVAIPWGTYARVAPRSGLALKKGIDTGAGVIDYDYRGPVGVVLFNHSDEDFHIKRGDRIAQMILERIEMADVAEVQELDATERGAGGFGSTGGHGSV